MRKFIAVRYMAALLFFIPYFHSSDRQEGLDSLTNLADYYKLFCLLTQQDVILKLRK